MKIRNGFVSNSSSSSFIIAVRKMAPCDKCGRSDPGFLEVLDRSSDPETLVITQGLNNLIDGYRQLIEEEREHPSWGGPDLEPLHSVLRLLETTGKTFDNAGCEVADVKISYHDEVAHELFESGKRAGSIVVLFDFEKDG